MSRIDVRASRWETARPIWEQVREKLDGQLGENVTPSFVIFEDGSYNLLAFVKTNPRLSAKSDEDAIEEVRAAAETAKEEILKRVPEFRNNPAVKITVEAREDHIGTGGACFSMPRDQFRLLAVQLGFAEQFDDISEKEDLSRAHAQKYVDAANRLLRRASIEDAPVSRIGISSEKSVRLTLSLPLPITEDQDEDTLRFGGAAAELCRAERESQFKERISDAFGLAKKEGESSQAFIGLTYSSEEDSSFDGFIKAAFVPDEEGNMCFTDAPPCIKEITIYGQEKVEAFFRSITRELPKNRIRRGSDGTRFDI